MEDSANTKPKPGASFTVTDAYAVSRNAKPYSVARRIKTAKEISAKPLASLFGGR